MTSRELEAADATKGRYTYALSGGRAKIFGDGAMRSLPQRIP
jgi:hypothetical protein